VEYGDIFLKILRRILSWNFVELRTFTLPALVVSYLQMQQTKHTLKYRSSSKQDYCSIQSLRTLGFWPRPVTFETETRHETFKTETRKYGSRDLSRDSITAIWQWRSQPKIFWGANLLILSEQQYLVWDTASQSTKWQEMLEIWGLWLGLCYLGQDIAASNTLVKLVLLAFCHDSTLS